MLGEMLQACQHFFWNFFNLIADYASAIQICRRRRLFPQPVSRTLNCDGCCRRFSPYFTLPPSRTEGAYARKIAATRTAVLPLWCALS